MQTETQTAKSVSRWCQDNDLSRSMFYQLRKKGLAPAVMKIGRRTLISAEADAAWRKRMEEEGQNQVTV